LIQGIKAISSADELECLGVSLLTLIKVEKI
jgi:hypothetical protein